MSVKIIKSNTVDHAFACVLRELARHRNSERNVVLVPDRFTLSVERDILSRLNCSGAFDIEVVSFTRFAVKSLKNRIKKCLTPEGSVMLLRRALQNLKGELGVYGESASDMEFVRQIYAVLTSFRNSGVTTDMLSEAAENSFSGAEIGEKLKDIIKIYNKYVELLGETHTDSTTRLYAFADYIPHMAGVENLNVYVCGFYDFTASQAAVAESLILSAKRAVFAVVDDYGAVNRRMSADGLKNLIEKICKARNVSCEITENRLVLDDCRNAILRKLFSYDKIRAAENGGYVRLLTAPNIESEVEFIAKRIKRLVFSGARYKTIGVALCDAQYADAFERVFDRYAIPYYLDKPEYFSKLSAIRFLTAAMRAPLDGYGCESVSEYVKNPLFYGFIKNGGCFDGAGYNDVERFENVFLKAVADDLRGISSDDETFNDVKDKVLTSTRFFEFGEDVAAQNFVDALRAFCNHIKFSEKNRALAEGRDEKFVKITAQIEDKLESVLDELSRTVGCETMSFVEFYELFVSVVDNIKISLVPLYSDSVYIGSPLESTFDGVDYLYVSGASESALPSSAVDTAVIGLKDERLLENAGICINPDKRKSKLMELFATAQLLIKPVKSVVITYAESIGGDKIQPSTVFMQLKDILCQDGKPLKILRIADERSYDSPEFDDKKRAEVYRWKFSTDKAILYELLANIVSENPRAVYMKPYDAAFAVLGEAQKRVVNRYLAVKPEELVLKNPTALVGGTFSASKIESYCHCPYRHYFTYGAGLAKKTDGRLIGANVGTVIHEVADRFVKEKAYERPESKIDAFVNAVINEEIESGELKTFNRALYKNTFKRLEYNCVLICKAIREQIGKSAFKPFKTEAKVGFSSNETDIQSFCIDVCGKKIGLLGFIDRVDKCGKYFTVIDYKSYSKTLNAKSVYTGENIQPLLYMRAVEKAFPDLRCAGLFYAPVRTGYGKKGADRFKMNGFVSDDSEVAALLDSGLEPNVSSSIFPVRLNKDGSVRKSEKVLRDVDFTAMATYAENMAKGVLEELRDGNITPSPVSGACAYCDYADICEFCGDEDYERKKFPKIKAEYFEKINGGIAIEADTGEENG